MRAPGLVPGTVLVAVLMATARWGSYLGLPARSVFVTEVLLVIGATVVVARYRGLLRDGLSERGASLLPVWLLLGWAALRLLTGGDLGAVALRDAAPYLYAGLAGCHLLAVSGRSRLRTTQVLVGALLVHLIWVTVVVLRPTLPASLPLLGDKVRLLELRPDVDGALLAVLAGLAAQRLLTVRSSADRGTALLLVLLPAYLVLEAGSRAALLALLAALVLVALVEAPKLVRIPKRVAAVAGVGAVLAVLAVVPQTGAYERLVGGTAVGNEAAGTASARQRAYELVVDYLVDEPSRLAVGVGFGPDFLQDSGADGQYEGTVYQDVRSPHNYLLGTLARLGAPGVLLLLWVVVLAATRFRRAVQERVEGAVLAGLVVTCFLVVSLFGVVLESPFGAVPFFWAAGLLIVHGRRAVTPMPEAEEQAPEDHLDAVGGPVRHPSVPRVRLVVHTVQPRDGSGSTTLVVRRAEPRVDQR